jgi:predicted transcriptional regulator
MSQTLSINVPDQLLDRLYRLARATDRPVEELVVSTLAESMPRPPTELPAEIRDELLALESLSDKELVQTARATLRAESLPASYTPGEAADRLALRKAYALVLLKWRGQPVPDLEGLAG